MSLLRAREAVMQHFRTLHRDSNITEQQWRVLRALFDSPPVDATTLAHNTCLHMPSLSRILQKLKKRRLVEQSHHKDDLRRSLISISPLGRELIMKEGPASEQQYAIIRKHFGHERLDLLYELLRDLEAALQKRPD
jgi:homoprotocatechuate degradation regulator HpaR